MDHGGLTIFRTVGNPLGGAVARELTNTEWEQSQRYVLNQCDDIKAYIEYKLLFMVL